MWEATIQALALILAGSSLVFAAIQARRLKLAGEAIDRELRQEELRLDRMERELRENPPRFVAIDYEDEHGTIRQARVDLESGDSRQAFIDTVRAREDAGEQAVSA